MMRAAGSSFRWLGAALCGAAVSTLMAVAGCMAPRGGDGLITLPDFLRRPAATGTSQATPAPGMPGVPVALPGADPAVGSKAVLSLLIRWPLRDAAGYRAAVIPAQTNSIAIIVKKGSTTLATRVVPRQEGGGVSTVMIELDADTGLTVEAKAFTETSPNLSTAKPIAEGIATGVNLAASRVTRVPLQLDLVGAPKITDLSPSGGGVGDLVQITGNNFGTGAATFSVKFGDTVAGGPVRSGDTAISVRVPAGAAVGNVSVTANGIQSTSTAVFWVASGVTLKAPAKASWDPVSLVNTRTVMLAKTLQLDASASFVVRSGSTLADFGTPPFPTFELSNSAAGTISATGLFTAGSEPVGTDVTANLGGVKSPVVKMNVQDVALSLSPLTGELYTSSTSSMRFTAVNTFSSGATNNAVTFTSSEPASLSVAADGLAQVTDPWASGSVVVTATSQANSSRFLTATVTIRGERNPYTSATFAGSDPGAADGPLGVAKFMLPVGVAFDPSGNLFVLEQGQPRIRKIKGGMVSTFAGNGLFAPQDGVGTGAGFGMVHGIATDATGTVYVTENHRLRRVSPTATVTTVAGAFDPGFKNGTGSEVRFNGPSGVAVGSDGTVYVADRYNHIIRKVASDGAVTTFAGNYQVDKFNTPIPGQADGTLATAKFNEPTALAFDPAGNLYVADTKNFRIRKIDTNGDVTTVAGSTQGGVDGKGASARFVEPVGLAYDTAGGFLYVSDAHRIRRVKLPSGEVMTVGGLTSGYADGLGSVARFNAPKGLAADASGSIYVADSINHRIRFVK